MKRFGTILCALSLTTGVMAQSEGKQPFFSQLTTKMAEKGILNHMDVGVNVGTLGFGIDVAVPVGDYVRVRAGYSYMPRFSIHSDFNVETSYGGKASSFINKFGRINEKLTEYDVDITVDGFKEERQLMESFSNGELEAKDYVTMSMKPDLHQFKFLVDVLPFKNNKHWSFTAGFFAGPSYVADACNMDKETAILKAVNLYNGRYYKDYILNSMRLKFEDAQNREHNVEIDPLTKFVKENGMAGFSLGTFKNDGRRALMLPGEDATVHADMKISKIRPYLGFGYNTHLSRDKKWNLNVDAGILILCGAPSIYVDNVYKIDASEVRFDEDGYYVSGIGTDEDGNYYGEIVRFNPDTFEYELCGEPPVRVDMVRDLEDVPGKVGSMVNTVSKFKVYPNASVTFSYRLF